MSSLARVHIRPATGRAALLVALVATVLAAGCSQPAPTSTPTAVPSERPSPTSSPTPTPGVGAAVASSQWEVVITGVRQADRLQSGLDSYHPNEGYTFLVVDTTIRALTMPNSPDATATSRAVAATRTAISTAGTPAYTMPPTAQAEISSAAVAILSQDGAIHSADGAIVSGMGCASCVTWSYASSDAPKEMSFVFVLRNAAAFQPYKLQFQDVPLIPFELAGEPPTLTNTALPSLTATMTTAPTIAAVTAAPALPTSTQAASWTPGKGPRPSARATAVAPTADTPEKLNLALTTDAQAATLGAQAAATIDQRHTQTAIAVASFTATATPNLEQTLNALVALTETSQAATDTANMIASYTKTPSATPTPTLTPTHTATPTHTPTPTSTFTPTATATPALIAMTNPPAELVLSPANAAHIRELTAIRASSGGGWADDLAISPDGKLLAANTMNNVIFYDLATLRELDSLTNSVGFHYGMVFSRDWSLLVSAGASQENSTITLWNPATHAPVGAVEGLGDFGANFSDGPIMALSPDGAHMAVRLGWPTQNVIKIVELPGGSVVQTLTLDNSTSLGNLTYAPDGQYLAAGSYDGVLVWNTGDWRLSTLDIGYPSTARHVTFSPDGRFLAALQASNPEQVYMWDAVTFQQALSFRASDQYPAFDGAMAFSPDGNILATGHDSGEVKLWNSSTGELLATLSGHAEEILAITFAPNGTGLLTSSQDGTLRLWGLATGAGK